MEVLNKVEIEYKFNQQQDSGIHDSPGAGSSYIIKLIIVTDIGFELIEEAGGYCKEHYPSREQRSLRAKSSNK